MTNDKPAPLIRKSFIICVASALILPWFIYTVLIINKEAEYYSFEPISGRLVDSETGEPISGAIVLAEWSLWGSSGLFTYSSGGHTLFHTAEAISDEDGAFTIPGKEYLKNTLDNYDLRLDKTEPLITVFKPNYFFSLRGGYMKTNKDCGYEFIDGWIRRVCTATSIFTNKDGINVRKHKSIDEGNKRTIEIMKGSFNYMGCFAKNTPMLREYIIEGYKKIISKNDKVLSGSDKIKRIKCEGDYIEI